MPLTIGTLTKQGVIISFGGVRVSYKDCCIRHVCPWYIDCIKTEYYIGCGTALYGSDTFRKHKGDSNECVKEKREDLTTYNAQSMQYKDTTQPSITQRLLADLRRSVDATTVIHPVLFNSDLRFQPSHVLEGYWNQNDKRLKIINTH